MTKAISVAIMRLRMGVSKSRPGAYMMTKSWSISGVPRMTHTNALVSQRSGEKRDMEPSVMISPKGMASASVQKNMTMFS